MRELIDELFTSYASEHEFYVIRADMGRFPKFEQAYPNRLIDVGCAETKAVNMAIGLVRSGVPVFLYSLAPFVLHRAWEQLFLYAYTEYKNSAPLTLMLGGAGFTYFNCGKSHHALDDISLMGLLGREVDISLPYNRDTLTQSFKLSIRNQTKLHYIRLYPDNLPEFTWQYTEKTPNTVSVFTHGWMLPRVTEICASIRKEEKLSVLPIVVPLTASYLYSSLHQFVSPSNLPVILVDDNIGTGAKSLLPLGVGEPLVMPIRPIIPIGKDTASSVDELLLLYKFGNNDIRSILVTYLSYIGEMQQCK